MAILDRISKLLKSSAGPAEAPSSPADASPEESPATATLPRAALKALKADLARLDKVGKGLGKAALRYVVSGDGGEVLLEISSAKYPASALHLYSAVGWNKRGMSFERRNFFDRCGENDGAVLHRLAEVYAAAWSPGAQTRNRLWAHLPDEQVWFEVLFREALELDYYYHSNRRRQSNMTAAAFEAALVAAGDNPDWLVRAILFSEPAYSYAFVGHQKVPRLEGLGAAFARHGDATVEALSHKKAQHRAWVVELLGHAGTPLDGPIRQRLEKLWVGTAKTVREAVEKLLNKDSEVLAASLPALDRYAAEGTAGERLQAVLALGRLAPERAATVLPGRLEVEKGSRIRSEIERILGVAAPGSSDEAGDGYDDSLVVPAAKTWEPQVAVPDELAAELASRFDRFNQRANTAAEKLWDATDPRYRRKQRSLKPQVSAKQARALARGLAEPARVARGKRVISLVNLRYNDWLAQELTEVVEETSLPLVAILRLGFLLGMVGKSETQRFYGSRPHESFLGWVRAHVAREDPALSLLDLAAACEAAGFTGDWIEMLYLDWHLGAEANPLELAPDAIWPFFVKRTEGLEAGLGIRESSRFEPRYYLTEFKRRAYAVLETFPRPPKAFVGYLWERALGTGKLERPLAQACLRNYPERHGPIIQALSNGRKDIRASAADWLGQLREERAVAPLKKALAKEKYDVPKAAMMGALETLGVEIDQFLNRKKLLAEAEKGLKKPVPKNLQWFPMGRLPEVHWQKNRQKVPPPVLRWFVVQTFRVKSPDPNPLLIRYCQLMRRDEREELGNFVFNAWLHQDTLPRYDHAQAAKLADQEVAQAKNWAKQYPQYYKDFDEDTYRKRSLHRFLHECMGSAVPSKGVLALAGACAGVEVVAPVERYLKQWYGQRLHQCKAMIRMLSWVDHPLAIQLILAVGTRFRTKSIQKEAAAVVDLIAERKGWSRDELADRTIPTAGFEADSTQTLDYGTRSFTARLEEDFSIRLINAAGKTIKSLPAANKSEDEAEVKAVKKQLSANRRELKQALKLQRERLYEAMCVERRWRFEDWDLYLNRHPIVGRFCQRLVWLAEQGAEDDGESVAFRPLPDQTLSDAEDETVALEPEDRVRIAHRSLLSGAEVAVWTEHLDDYEVEPLFRQFGGEHYRPSQAAAESTGIEDFEGHLVNTFKLRSRAGKLGYTRGSAEDGGWFHTYLKSFPSLELQAVLEFTGNCLPEENRTAALLKAYFIRQRKDQPDRWSYSHRPLKLKAVPDILLSETYNDLRTIAADGAGFDPEWSKKAAW